MIQPYRRFVVEGCLPVDAQTGRKYTSAYLQGKPIDPLDLFRFIQVGLAVAHPAFGWTPESPENSSIYDLFAQHDIRPEEKLGEDEHFARVREYHPGADLDEIGFQLQTPRGQLEAGILLDAKGLRTTDPAELSRDEFRRRARLSFARFHFAKEGLMYPRALFDKDPTSSTSLFERDVAVTMDISTGRPLMSPVEVLQGPTDSYRELRAPQAYRGEEPYFNAQVDLAARWIDEIACPSD